MSDIKIFRKDINHECLYCYSCGKKTVYFNSKDHYLFSCSKCNTEFIMMGVVNYEKIKTDLLILISSMDSEEDIIKLKKLMKINKLEALE